MKKLFKLRQIAVLKTSQKEAGFTTLEILIQLLIALGFVAVSMQSLVYAMAMKVQAQEKQRANELIQEDVVLFLHHLQQLHVIQQIMQVVMLKHFGLLGIIIQRHLQPKRLSKKLDQMVL